MILYCDATALAALYADEPGREIVERALSGAGRVVTSAVTEIEMRRALQRADEHGYLSHRQHRRALAAFERDWRGFVVLDVSASIARVAGRIAGESTRLSITRTIHLASALATKAALERVNAAVSGRGFGSEKPEDLVDTVTGAGPGAPLLVSFLTCDPTLYSPARNMGLTVVYGS